MHSGKDSPAPQLVESYDLPCLVRASGAGADTPPPLLCFLHGYDEGAPLEISAALRRHGPLRPGNPVGCIDRFVIVAPQLPIRGDLWLRYAPQVGEIVADQARQHGCDARRFYLTGFSFGGNGVFDLALAQPGRWAALWPVDPTRVPTRQIAAPLWLSLGEISRYQSRAFIRQLALTPATQGTAGERVWEDDGEDHVGTATLAYRDERIYAWLLGRRSE